MTQLEAARTGLITAEMRRVAQRECVTPEFVRDEVARGRLVIPANQRHLAGSGGQAPSDGHDRSYPAVAVGHPGAGADARLWVNQTVAQRWAVIRDPNMLRGEGAPRRLDPTGIGRMITTKINANIGASPVSSSTAEEVEKLEWAQKYGADTLMDLSTGGDLAACRQAIIDHATIPIGTVPIYSMIVGRAIEDLTYDVILKEIERQAAQGVDYFTIPAGVLRDHLPLIGPRVTGIVSRGGSLLAKWMIHHGRQNPMYELFDEISAIMRAYDVTYSLGDGLRPGCLADASDAAQLAELRTLGELVQRAREAGVQAMVEGPGHVPLDQIAWNMRIEQEICDDAPFSRARAALNWPRQFELALDGETARALHDEDLEVDTDFCAMCGHDWCSMRISKEIQAFASGKDAGFQPARRAQRSPGVGEEGRELLRQRGAALPVIDGKHACHSDHVPDAERARAVQTALAKP